VKSFVEHEPHFTMEHQLDALTALLAVGSIMDTTNVYRMNLTSALTIPIDAVFNVAAGGGRSDQDSLSNNTWYGVFLLSKSTDPSDTKAIFATTRAKSLTDTVAAAAGFDISRLVGYVLTDGSANIVKGVPNGNGAVVWNTYLATSYSPPATAGLAVAVRCPPFQIADVGMRLRTSQTTVVYGILMPAGQDNTAPVALNSQVAARGSDSDDDRNDIWLSIKTNGSSQVRYRVSDATNTSVNIGCRGYRMDYTVTDLV
jgi:hypothetical protein